MWYKVNCEAGSMEHATRWTSVTYRDESGMKSGCGVIVTAGGDCVQF